MPPNPSPESVEDRATWVAHNPAVLSSAPRWIFDPAALTERGLVEGSGEGRGTTWFFTHGGASLALRHYRRGGLASRLSDDSYLWTGLRRSRPWREWQALLAFEAAGLPAPRPAAVRVLRSGPLYRADLITVRIPGARTFSRAIRHGLEGHRPWKRVGAAIRRFHDAGWWHADLNARNILLDEELKVWLIDWDRGRRRSGGRHWRPANLARLRRSLAKNPAVDRVADEHWDWLLAGYEGGRAPLPAHDPGDSSRDQGADIREDAGKG